MGDGSKSGQTKRGASCGDDRDGDAGLKVRPNSVETAPNEGEESGCN